MSSETSRAARRASVFRVHRGSLKKSSRRLEGTTNQAKLVRHHANTQRPERCFVSLFKRYRQLCPPDAPPDAFYLQPACHPTESCWYSNCALGHNSLGKTLSRLCSSAGIAGYKTNHSLCATATSRLYHSGVDEQLVMERTGHRSVEGVRSYKRTSDQQREVLSDILNRAPTPKHTASHLPCHSAPTLTQSASQQVLQGLSLPSATFHSCNLNFYLGSNSVLSPTDTNTTPKKRRAMVLYDSDSD